MPTSRCLQQASPLLRRAQLCGRYLSSSGLAFAPGMEGTPSGASAIFDRELKAAHRDRASYLQADEDPLLAEVTNRLLDRLEDCKRSFPTVAAVGGAAGHVVRQLSAGRAGIQTVLHLDPSETMLRREHRLTQAKVAQGVGLPKVEYEVADEEELPLEPESLDAVICCLNLHWVNDVPGAMMRCRFALRPDGLFLAAMWGGDTLHELRVSLALAEQEVEGGISPRISPFVQVRDAGNLLTRAGLGIPSVDVDDITVHYRSPAKLVDHLRAMGETNAVRARRPTMSRRTAEAAWRIYRERFGNEDGSIPATFQVIYMTGWAPHASHQRSKDRGSATVSLAELSEALGRKPPAP